MSESQSPNDKSSNIALEKASPSVLVIDIGKKQSKKRIKRLRKGKGKLFEKVNETIGELKSRGAIGENVQPLVIIVRKKETKILGW